MVGKYKAQNQPRWFRRHPRRTAAAAVVALIVGVLAVVAGADERHDATYSAGDTVAVGFTWPAQNGNWVASDGSGDQAGMWVENCKDVGNNPGTYVRLALDSNCRVHVVVSEGAGHAYAIHQVGETPVSTTATTATTPTTTATTATTTTTAAPEPDPCEHAMQNNEIRLVHAPCKVKGDIQVSTGNQNGPWTTLYDDDPATGLVVSFTADTYVRTPWGANVTGRSLESIETELKSVGCVGGCASVVKKTWPEGGSTTTTTVNGSTTTTSATGSTTSTTTTGSSTSTTARECAVTTIAAGQTKNVPAGSVLDGDVKVNGTALYDNDPATALRVVFNESATVSAEWGASYVPSGCEIAASTGLIVKQWPAGSTATTNLSHVQNGNSTSTTMPSNSTTVTDTCVAQIAPGQTLQVKAGCHIQGDVMVNGVAKYDNLQETGLVVVLTKDATIKAPWGASVSAAAVEDIKASMMMIGCGLPAGCSTVNVVSV